MSSLRLSLALSGYVHTNELTNGRVRPDGIDLTIITQPFESIALRFRNTLEFDVCEYSFANYCARLAHFDKAPMIALPVFTSRVFRHSSIFIRTDAGIDKPADLAGRRVAIPQWTQTATVYVRGYLAHDAGVSLSSIEWVQAGVNEPGRKEGVTFLKLPAGIKVTPAPDRSINGMLLSGEIDAAITARPPRAFTDGHAGIRRLFPDYRRLEEDYYRRTGIFPIMHAIVIRRDVYEANRWIARNLYDAFEAAKRAGIANLGEITTSYLPTAWGPEHVSSVNSILFRDADPWPYGMRPNRPTLSAFLEYCFEQGITERKLTMEELFAPELAFEMPV
jgi:4,5-dihydroxyphthalate decarboxylase